MQHPFLALDPAGAATLYRQIYTRFRTAIAEGLLAPGERVPAARGLAAELGLARGTVEAAYTLLIAEGYFTAKGQAGTFVTPRLDARALASPRQRARASADAQPAGTRASFLPFQMGLPALDAFPRKIWARLAARCARATNVSGMIQHPDAPSALWRAIASYLQVSRAIECVPEQVFITGGYRNTLDLVCRGLLKTGDSMWTEDPGYPPTRELLHQAGIEVVPIPVDAEGLVVATGIERAAHARGAVVTPAHQSPLCVTMSLARRLELLDWADHAQAWIVEDDYDGEYRYVSQPLPALKSLDRRGRVLYAGSFSKVLFPGLRLGYLVVPEALIGLLRETARIFQGGPANLTQDIVAGFMAEGHFARHIQRMRRLYAERRQAVVAGLDAVFDDRMRIEPQPGGMHLVVRTQGSDRELADRMRADGMSVHALSEWAVRAEPPPAILISFTNIPTESAARALGRRIMAQIE